jgi:hypothetical protein
MVHLLAVAFVAGMLINSSECKAAQSSVSIVQSSGYVTGEEERSTLRFDTLSVRPWGVVYGRADLISPVDSTYTNTLVRGIGHLGTGLHLSGHVQAQRGVSQTSLGVGYSSFSKDQSWFVDLYKMSSSYYGEGTHAFLYGTKNLGDWKAVGFLEYTVPEARLEPVLFSQSSVLYHLGHNVNLGVEHQRYFNKNGIRGLDESVNQLVIKWDF